MFYFVEHLRTAASGKQQMHYRFSIKMVLLKIHLPEK